MNTIRKLATQHNLGGTLPPIKFFEPTARFLRWMKDTYRNEIVYDVGAGVGHVAQALSKRGIKVLGIDISYRESTNLSQVLIADGESYKYLPDAVVMLCRPCHGQFTGEVIAQALRCKVAAVLYVGLERNVEADLGVYRDGFTPVLTGAGREGECVWVGDIPSLARSHAFHLG